MKNNKIIITFSIYFLGYIALRLSRIMVHAGGYYDGGVLKFHDHRIETEATLDLLFPDIYNAINFIYAPAKLAETFFWFIVHPI